MNKTTTHYFNSAKSLPLAMSFSQVKAFVAETGIPPHPPKSGWGLKNFLIMTTSIITISAALLLSLNTSDAATYVSRESTIKNTVLQERTVPLVDSTKKKTSAMEMVGFTEVEQEEEAQRNTSETKEESINEKIEFIKPKVDLIKPIQPLARINQTSSIFGSNDNPENKGSFLIAENSADSMADFEPFGLFNDLMDIEFKDTTKINGSSKTIQKSIDAAQVNSFLLKHNNGNVLIKTGNSKTATLTASITIEGKTDEDERIALEDFDLDFVIHKNQLGIEYNWSGDVIGDCFCWSSSKKNKIETSSGETVKIKKIEVNYELILPSNIDLDLTNRYGDIAVADRAGNMTVVLFKGDLEAGNIAGDINLTEKYGKAQVKSAENTVFNLFKGELTLGSSKKVKGKLSYSKLTLTKAENLNLTSFQSDATIIELSNSLQSNFRYGDLRIQNDLKNMKLIAFQAKIEAASIDESNLSLSYTKLKMKDANQLVLEKAFQSKIVVNEVNQISGKANFSPIEIKKVRELIDLNTFQGSIDVASVEPSFTKINLNTRFTNVELNFNPLSNYRFEAKTSFTAVNMPSNVQNMNMKPSNGDRNNYITGEVNRTSDASNSLVYIESFQGKVNLQ